MNIFTNILIKYIEYIHHPQFIQSISIFYDGLPSNKITAIAGESATGKTFFVLGMVKHFLDANPNGGVLSTTNSKLTDKSKVTSLKQTIQFDGALQKVKWSFPEKGLLTGKLMKGKYTAELWTRGLMRQKNNFTLE